jgi:hypothetical protein
MSIYPYVQNYVPNQPVCALSVSTPDLSVCDSAKVKLYSFPSVSVPSANDVMLFQPDGSSTFISSSALATSAGPRRPAGAVNGQMFFDTTLGVNGGRPIWWSSSASSWVYSDGSLVL